MATLYRTDEPIKIAVRCDKCCRVIAYKLSATSGYLQLKCPKCGSEVKVDLSLRRARGAIFYRRVDRFSLVR